MYKNLKMSHPESPQYVTLRNNLDIYNNILKNYLATKKNLYYEACLKKI